MEVSMNFLDWKHKVSAIMLFMLGLALTGCASTPSNTKSQSQSTGTLHHLVIIWLKQPGDATVRQQYIDASKPLANLPGVLSYELGIPATIKRSHANASVNESYDVAIASVFESPQAYEAFLKNPQYAQIAQGVLRPLVEKYQVYDFIAP
jgi:hypothetical protein